MQVRPAKSHAAKDGQAGYSIKAWLLATDATVPYVQNHHSLELAAGLKHAPHKTSSIKQITWMCCGSARQMARGRC